MSREIDFLSKIFVDLIQIRCLCGD